MNKKELKELIKESFREVFEEVLNEQKKPSPRKIKENKKIIRTPKKIISKKKLFNDDILNEINFEIQSGISEPIKEIKPNKSYMSLFDTIKPNVHNEQDEMELEESNRFPLPNNNLPDLELNDENPDDIELQNKLSKAMKSDNPAIQEKLNRTLGFLNRDYSNTIRESYNITNKNKINSQPFKDV